MAHNGTTMYFLFTLDCFGILHLMSNFATAKLVLFFCTNITAGNTFDSVENCEQNQNRVKNLISYHKLCKVKFGVKTVRLCTQEVELLVMHD